MQKALSKIILNGVLTFIMFNLMSLFIPNLNVINICFTAMVFDALLRDDKTFLIRVGLAIATFMAMAYSLSFIRILLGLI